MPLVSFPPAPRVLTSTSTVINGATVVTLAFDAEGVVAAAAGSVSVGDARIEGTDTVVLDITVPRDGLRAAIVGLAGTVRVGPGQLVYTVAGGLPEAGGATILLTPRSSTTRANNTLAPAPPADFVYTERDGQSAALGMVLDSRTQAVSIEACDSLPGDKVEIWREIRSDAATPGPRAIGLTLYEDVTGRRFRAVALRTVDGDVLMSSPSAQAYRNRPPVSAGNVAVVLVARKAPHRVSLAGIVTDPDGGAVTFRVLSRFEFASRDSLPSWITRDGDALLVDGSRERAAVALTVLGVDERGASATATLTVSVITPTLAAPTAVLYLP